MSEARDKAPAGMDGWVAGKDGSAAAVAAMGADLPWRWREGDLTVTRTAAWSAPGCHLGCGVKVYTDDKGRFVKLEGDEENPFNQGRLCVRCLSFQQVLENPQRLRYPMRRAREDRGKDAWERVSWDEAYDLICDKFAEIEEYGPWAVLFAVGHGARHRQRHVPHGLFLRLAQHRLPADGRRLLTGPRITATSIMMGNYCVPDCSMYFADRYDNPQWKPPGVIFVWGNNPLVSNADGNVGHWMVDCMKARQQGSWSLTRASPGSRRRPTCSCGCAPAPTPPWRSPSSTS